MTYPKRFRRSPRGMGWVFGVLGMVALGPAPGHAQVIGRERLVTIDGVRLGFPDGSVWQIRGARVRRGRAGRIPPVRFDAARAMSTSAAMAGTLHVPSVMFAFADTDTTRLARSAVIDSVLFSSTPLSGRPYSMRTLYAEMSNGLLDVDGDVFGWVVADSSEAYFLDSCNGSNPLDCSRGRNRYGAVFREALGRLDGSVDFARFDNDGPDNIPNSGDDDGVVDVIQFVQPVLGGECNGPGMWAHKFGLSNVGGIFVTDDARAGGGFVSVDAYFIVSGVGGGGCDAPDEPMPIGVAAHELGHGLGLPDLYDTGGGTAGIGEWGLMGSGIYSSLNSPTHYSAWSKEQMGWVTVREITNSGTYTVGPVITADTVLVVRPPGDNPKGEYFLLENKQPVLADTSNLETGRNTGPKLGGLLIWHIDSVEVARGTFSNTVNNGLPHGVALFEADGRDDLQRGSNRGDAGDPYPGTSGNTRLSLTTVPRAITHYDNGFVGFQIDSIRQLVPGGAMSVRVVFGRPTVVRASDTTASVRVDGVPYFRFADLMEAGRSYEIGIDSVQLGAAGRSEFRFVSWSNDSARVHAVTDVVAGDSLVAEVAARHRVRAVIAGAGSVSAGELPVTSGAFVPEDSVVTLVAQPGPGLILDGWSGDTLALGDTLTLTMTKPFDINATFVAPLAFTGADPRPAVMGAAYLDTLDLGGGFGPGTYSYRVVQGDLPRGIEFRSNDQVAELVGLPEETGDFPLLIEARSGNQVVLGDVPLQVQAPALEPGAVTRRLVGLDSPLNPDETRYLDLLGNQNDRFDVGDFLAWIDATGGDRAAALADLAAARQAAGR